MRMITRASHTVSRTVAGRLTHAVSALAAGLMICAHVFSTNVHAQPRRLQPADLFAIEEVGRTAWSSDGDAIAVEFCRNEKILDWGVPACDLRVLDVRAATWKTLGARNAKHVGFFGPAWSPNGRTLLFLSVDSNAIVRPWIWTRGTPTPRQLRNVQIVDGFADKPFGLWTDDSHIVFLARDTTTVVSGQIYAALFAQRNAADRWRVAYEGRAPSVAVMRSRSTDSSTKRGSIVSVNVETNTIAKLAIGAFENLRLTNDRSAITYRSLHAPLTAFVDSTLFGADTTEADYLRVSMGDETHAIDLRTGKKITLPVQSALPPRDTSVAPPPAPRSDARRKALSPNRNAALYVSSADSDGTNLWLARRDAPAINVWSGNAWVRNIHAGTSERIDYTDSTGKRLIGWVLYPPNRKPGERLPVVTIVYPGSVWTEIPPEGFSLLYRWVENTQLFAALGYAVVLPSIPYPRRPLRGDMIAPLLTGTMPLLDTLIARGIIDANRMTLLGQSAGGYSVQAMITRTNRFRSAISTAGYSNLLSLYGTFYGQFRHGDGGDPQISTAFRMMQFERGMFGAGAPPWREPARYIANSPLFSVDRVQTPIMIVQGNDDFISVQQSEEFFSALYRLGKRAEFVRYYGEDHSIARRANALDLWVRIRKWLDGP